MVGGLLSQHEGQSGRLCTTKFLIRSVVGPTTARFKVAHYQNEIIEYCIPGVTAVQRICGRCVGGVGLGNACTSIMEIRANMHWEDDSGAHLSTYTTYINLYYYNNNKS